MKTSKGNIEEFILILLNEQTGKLVLQKKFNGDPSRVFYNEKYYIDVDHPELAYDFVRGGEITRSNGLTTVIFYVKEAVSCRVVPKVESGENQLSKKQIEIINCLGNTLYRSTAEAKRIILEFSCYPLISSLLSENGTITSRISTTDKDMNVMLEMFGTIRVEWNIEKAKGK